MKPRSFDQQMKALRRRVASVRKEIGALPRRHAPLQRRFGDLADALAALQAAAKERHEPARESAASLEHALRESEARAGAIVDTAVDGIITIDDTGRIVSFNPAAERLFGHAATDVIGRNVKVLMPEPIRNTHDDYIASYLRTGLKKIIGVGREVVGRRRDGTTFPIDLAVSEVQLARGRLFTGTIRDITDRKQSERRLAAQYAVTRVLAEAATAREAMPKLLQAICEGTGWGLGELWRVDREATLLRWDGSWHAPEVDAAKFEARSRTMTFAPGDGLPGRVWATGEPAWLSHFTESAHFSRGAEAAQVGLEGAFFFPVQRGTEVIGIMAFFGRDTTHRPDDDVLRMLEAFGRQIGDFIARKQAEEALRESDRRFASFMQNLPGVAFMKDAEGRYVYVNEPFEELYHKRRDEWLGHTDLEMWPPATAHQFSQNDRFVLEHRTAMQTIEIVPHDDGLHSWLVSKFPILSESGTAVMVAGIAVDVTERERATVELREMQKLAQQRERLADIGAITAQIVHDLGNPLAGVSMQAQLILRRAARDASQPIGTILQPAERIVAEVHRLDALIKEFMDFSREQRLDLKPVDLGRFLDAVVGMWGPVASGRGIMLTVDVPQTTPALTADEEKLHRVFENLVKNAVEAIDRGPGRVQIRVEASEADRVRIAVEDSGPGIEESVEVFRLFETTKPQGTGLGLPIVRQIVLAHGGGIGFAPAKPHGTIFYVEFPCRGPLT